VYQSYWGLGERPFDTTPDPRFFFRAAVEETYARLYYGLRTACGAAMLTGEAGCGKTMMARALVQELELESTEVALITSPPRQAPELLRDLLLQLGDGETTGERARILHRINEILYERFSGGRETLVIIDEAQLLDDPEIFEEIRLLLNLQLNDAYLLTILLVGQASFAKRVGRFSALDERISARGVLRPLGQIQVGPYVAHRLRVAGRVEPIFTADAVELIGQYAGGIPRRINSICDLSLAIGFSRQVELIDQELVYQIVMNEEESHV
jgi:general secretion pathway protein A